MKDSQNKNKGFSLVEVLLAVVVLTIVIVPLTNTFIGSSKINQKAKKVQSATEMAQNMCEGITSKKPSKSIVELSAFALSNNVELEDPPTVLPANDGYDKIGEYKVAIDSTTGAYTYTEVDDANHGYYVKLKRLLDPTTSKYRCIGLNKRETETDAYGFYVQGLKQGNTYYDLRITLDPTAYETTYATVSDSYKYLSNIYSVDTRYDSVYTEGTSLLENTVLLEYKTKRLNGTVADSDILKFLKRTYTITLSNRGTTAAPQYVVGVGIDYDYLRTADLAYGQTPNYTMDAEQIFDSSSSGKNPRNIYIYYSPNYCSQTVGGELDNFVIDNQADLDVNVYLIRTKQETSTLFGSDNVTTSTREKNYAATVKVQEQDDTDVNTMVRSNFGEDITKDYDDSDRQISSPKIKYSVNVPGSVRNAALTSILISQVKTLELKKEDVRKYDVKIEVFAGKSGGSGDNNGYYSYDGAYANDFPDGTKLAEFTGSTVDGSTVE